MTNEELRESLLAAPKNGYTTLTAEQHIGAKILRHCVPQNDTKSIVCVIAREGSVTEGD